MEHLIKGLFYKPTENISSPSEYRKKKNTEKEGDKLTQAPFISISVIQQEDCPKWISA